ncbi:SWIM zinc finger family protein [Peribacillus glennii]|uniref:SWIM zinc finger family protein n=1 Tax=Peribacillus glennii TaxID=2303991 RepID=A0A372L7R2_9BACI|nr:SWIM zinc finger family protein [Peribacillus glennii]RFU60751.1 SWIM zinc finger family protein [Peribacillus glennii]
MSTDLMFFAGQLEDLLNPKVPEDLSIVQKGLVLYRQTLVSDKHATDDFITAKVQDVVPVEVKLDKFSASLSTCSCGSDFFCRHRMAVFFSAYSELGSVSEWVLRFRGRNIAANSKTPLPIQRASDIMKTKTNGVLEKSYPAWKEFITSAFREVIESNLQLPSYLLDEKIRTYLQKVRAKAPMEREWKNLYSFVADFTTLLLTVELIRNNIAKTAVIRVFYSLADDLAEDLHASVQHVSRQARPFAFDPFFEGIREDVAGLLDGMDAFEYEKTDVYRAIWSFLLTNSAWRKAELERVQEKLSARSLHHIEETSYRIAAIHLFMLSGRDEEAAALLNRLDKNACPYLYYWLKRLSDLEADQRAAPLIEFLNANIRSFLKELSDYYKATDFVRTFSGPVSNYCYKMKRMDVLEKFFRECLPYSYWNYANFLFEQEHYKKWVEMHIYSDISIDVIGTENLKKVAAHDPALVLPLYYHAVQYTISQKNRPAYKQAVRYLKRMRTLYKKMKDEETFNEYVEYIKESTKRLRAFQEELQRSKLIHD